MQKSFLKTYLVIFVLILLILSLSSSHQDKIRNQSLTFLTPLWNVLSQTKRKILSDEQTKREQTLTNELKSLELENYLLKTELNDWHKIVDQPNRLMAQFDEWVDIAPRELLPLSLEQQKALKQMMSQWKWMNQAVPSRVIFRSWDHWNQSLWINVGDDTNKQLDQPLIKKNSPVVFGRAVVGVIDYVGKNQSHVRLLTDAKLHPSVRAVRGGEQDLLIIDYLEGILQQLQRKKQTVLSSSQQENLIQILNQLRKKNSTSKQSFYLAKGELQGSTSLFKKGEPIKLKGIGFNYDFPDEEGGARDLRSGKLAKSSDESAIPILKVNDLLMTTGMDGIFPAGLHVAIVTKIELLKEGDYFYTIEAQPLVGSLEELTTVFVLPPLNEDEQNFKIIN